MTKTPQSAKAFVTLMALAAAGALTMAALRWHSSGATRFLLFLAMSLIASRLKVTLPRLTGSMSFNVPFLLLGMTLFGFSETVLVATISTVVQCLPPGRPGMRPIQFLFNVSTITVAMAAARIAFRGPWTSTVPESMLWLVVAGATYFLVNTVPVAVIISLTEEATAWKTWKQVCLLSYPYFLLGATIAGTMVPLEKLAGWAAPLVVLPVVFGVFQSYRAYFADRAPQPASA